MPRFAANLTYLFHEHAFLDRFEAAAQAGFKAVEFHFPYHEPHDEIEARIRATGLRIVQSNVPSGNLEVGEWGIAIYPDMTTQFREALLRGLEFADRFGVGQLHCLAGIRPESLSAEVAEASYIRHLSWAAGEAAKASVRLLVEPINDRDTPGFFLNRCDQAIDLLQQIGSDNIFLQYDCYHGVTMGEAITTVFEEHIDLIRHVQISGRPGRHEPDAAQDIDYPVLFKLAASLGYEGWYGCEYRPRTNTIDGLEWMSPWQSNT